MRKALYERYPKGSPNGKGGQFIKGPAVLFFKIIDGKRRICSPKERYSGEVIVYKRQAPGVDTKDIRAAASEVVELKQRVKASKGKKKEELQDRLKTARKELKVADKAIVAKIKEQKEQRKRLHKPPLVPIVAIPTKIKRSDLVDLLGNETFESLPPITQGKPKVYKATDKTYKAFDVANQIFKNRSYKGELLEITMRVRVGNKWKVFKFNYSLNSKNKSPMGILIRMAQCVGINVHELAGIGGGGSSLTNREFNGILGKCGTDIDIKIQDVEVRIIAP